MSILPCKPQRLAGENVFAMKNLWDVAAVRNYLIHILKYL